MSGMKQGIEAELILWKASYDSQIGGRLIFEISKDELEPFYGLPTKKGGQRFAAVLVLIGDDEKPVPVVAPTPNTPAGSAAPPGPTIAEAAAERKQKAHFPGGFCGLAVQWCDDVRFREWAEQEFPDFWAWTYTQVTPTNKTADIERAAILIKKVCAVESRRELDTDKDAHNRFEKSFRQPYMAYLHEEQIA